MTPFPDHPGTIRVVDAFRRTSQDSFVAGFPASAWFVYLKDGVETSDPDQATERVPVVEVHVSGVDPKGDLVPAERAPTVRVEEFGPGRRPLRTTTVRRQ
jgi:hypothetical protein